MNNLITGIILNVSSKLGTMLSDLHILSHLMFITTLYVVFIITICQMRKLGLRKKLNHKIIHIVSRDAYDPLGGAFTLENKKLLN